MADDIAELHALDLAEPPWIGQELAGLVEFAAFTVPPGSRRGVVPGVAAQAFAEAMRKLGVAVSAELRRLERERRAAADRQVVQELRKALRGLRTRLPQYDLPDVRGGAGTSAGDGERGGTGAPAEGEAEELGHMVHPELFPAGPIATAQIVPDPVEVAPGHEHRARAEVRDENGRVVREGMTFRWTVEGAGLAVHGEGPRPAVAAEGTTRVGVTGRLRVTVEKDGRAIEAGAAVEVVEPRIEETGLGIPEPSLVDAPGETWRSRFDGQHWEVNQMHEDYLALKAEARARLRYLLALLARDLAQYAHRVPGAAEASEDVVAILALAERNLRGV